MPFVFQVTLSNSITMAGMCAYLPLSILIYGKPTLIVIFLS